MFIDGGTWYPWTLKKVGFKRHTIIFFGTRSAIELLLDDIEQRIRRFWNCFIGKYIRNSMERLVEAFVGFRNWKIESKGELS